MVEKQANGSYIYISSSPRMSAMVARYQSSRLASVTEQWSSSMSLFSREMAPADTVGGAVTQAGAASQA